MLYFGVLKDLLRRDRDRVELAEAASVERLLAEIRKSEAGDDHLWKSLAVAVNQVYAQRDHLLSDGDEVALLPPVSGGTARRERAA